MRAVCVLEKNVTDFVLQEMHKIMDIDLIVFRYGIIDDIDFSTQQEESQLYDLAILSNDLSCVVLAGCDTYLCGAKRQSCLVYDKGKLLAVADSNYASDGGGYVPGFGYRVFDTTIGSFGVALGDDIKHAAPCYIISHALGDYIFYISDKNLELEYKNYAKACCMLGGLDGLFIFADDAFFCTSGGEIEFGSGERVRLVELKRTAKYFDIRKKERR